MERGITQDLKFYYLSSAFWSRRHITTGGSVQQKMDRKEWKRGFFFQVFSCALFSFFSCSGQRRKQAAAHRRAVMWFQCLRPCGIVPSGGKPLRLCWHITTPIINSRSALSFLLRLSPFLLIAASFCFAFALISVPGSFTSAHPKHFPSNLPSQQSHLFSPFFPLLTTLLYHTEQLPPSPKNYLLCTGAARIWPGNVSPNGSTLDCEDDQTREDLMIQLISRRHRSLKHCNPQESYTITFKLGVSNERTSLIDFPLPTFTSQVSLSLSSIPFLFHWSLLFFPLVFHSSYFLSDPAILEFLTHFYLLHFSHVLWKFLLYIYFILRVLLATQSTFR